MLRHLLSNPSGVGASRQIGAPSGRWKPILIGDLSICTRIFPVLRLMPARLSVISTSTAGRLRSATAHDGIRHPVGLQHGDEILPHCYPCLNLCKDCNLQFLGLGSKKYAGRGSNELFSKAYGFKALSHSSESPSCGFSSQIVRV